MADLKSVILHTGIYVKKDVGYPSLAALLFAFAGALGIAFAFELAK